MRPPASLPVTPLRRAGSDFVSASGRDLIADKIRQLCMTCPGELPWRPSFGVGLDQMRHRNNDETTATIARSKIREGLAKWLGPGVTVDSVTAARHILSGILALSVIVRVDGEQIDTLVEIPRQGIS